MMINGITHGDYLRTKFLIQERERERDQDIVSITAPTTQLNRGTLC